MAPNTDIATRALVVALKAPCSGKTTEEVAAITGLSTRQVNRIYARAIYRGFDPNLRPLVIRDEYLRDAPRSGRPPKQTEETKKEVFSKLAGLRSLCYDGLEGTAKSWVPEDQANEEAWVDEEDEERTP
ncbi:hypothetical protein NCS57_00656700 [Fusarium keratoplasticum]|uniref:Uncharacterized protein n=1 Tax=Fusarium keratoplasticum TaxID=1328300 RepID=A0ACC0R1Y4_9HYPO|nr:hypothetical protein NCS57_00656700 [Fusarium keratoplasticum]KAI8671803.1 hypothetical protein NCS57_00656700 [Fusarium keratoplasticum]